VVFFRVTANGFANLRWLEVRKRSIFGLTKILMRNDNSIKEASSKWLADGLLFSYAK
jgi:hypothetical protein